MNEATDDYRAALAVTIAFHMTGFVILWTVDMDKANEAVEPTLKDRQYSTNVQAAGSGVVKVTNEDPKLEHADGAQYEQESLANVQEQETNAPNVLSLVSSEMSECTKVDEAPMHPIDST